MLTLVPDTRGNPRNVTRRAKRRKGGCPLPKKVEEQVPTKNCYRGKTFQFEERGQIEGLVFRVRFVLCGVKFFLRFSVALLFVFWVLLFVWFVFRVLFGLGLG